MAWVALVVLLLCSFFFSGTETAVTAVSRPLLHEQAKRGNKWAEKLLELAHKIKPNNLEIVGIKEKSGPCFGRFAVWK